MTQGRQTTMIEIRNIIQRLRNGQSDRSIYKETGVHRRILSKIRKIGSAKYWLNPTLPMPSDEEIVKIWQPKAKIPHPLDLHRDNLEQWHKEGVTAVVMHQLLKDKCPSDVQAIRRYLCQHFPKPIMPVMVRSSTPGKEIDIDYGYLGIFLDDKNISRKAWVFSFRLRHSRKAFRIVVLDQSARTFLQCHVFAFEYFNGVSSIVVLDNTKAAVIKSTVDNDMISRSYQELAEHYGFIISPCLPRTPEHKGGIESDIKYIKGNFLSFFLQRQKEKNIKQPRLCDLIEALKKWGEEVSDTHNIHGVGRSPNEIFKSEEEKALLPLPETRWELTSWSKYTIRRDWRIMYDSAYYSVPYSLIGKEVFVCITESFVRIFHEHKEITSHARMKEKWAFARKAEHAPPLQEEVLQCTREGLLIQAENVGPFTYQVAFAILSHPSVDKLRPVRCLLKLGIKYSKERLENACQRASVYKMYSYQNIKNILINDLDKQTCYTPTASKIIEMPQYRFVRDPADYKSSSAIDAPKKKTFEEKLEEMHPFSKNGNAMSGTWNSLMADQIMEDK